MITTEGKIYIKRYLAGWVPSIAESIAYGIGGKAEAVGDLALEFEIGRADIELTSYDFTTNKLIFKATLPNDFNGIVYEIGLFSQEKNAVAGEFGSNLVTTFDSASENWFDPVSAAVSTFTTAGTRVGADSLRLSPAASATARARMAGLALDFSENSTADKFVLAGTMGSNVSNVQVLFMVDTSNYFTISFGAQTAGYRVLSTALGNAALTGTPTWDNINMIEVRAIATAGGAAVVDFDGLRIEDTDSPNPEYVMVSRELLGTPFTKEAGRSQTIEFALDVSV